VVAKVTLPWKDVAKREAKIRRIKIRAKTVEAEDLGPKKHAI
jgi:hypothetical protein